MADSLPQPALVDEVLRVEAGQRHGDYGDPSPSGTVDGDHLRRLGHAVESGTGDGVASSGRPFTGELDVPAILARYDINGLADGERLLRDALAETWAQLQEALARAETQRLSAWDWRWRADIWKRLAKGLFRGRAVAMRVSGNLADQSERIRELEGEQAESCDRVDFLLAEERKLRADIDRLGERNATLESACQEARRKADDHRRQRDDAREARNTADNRASFLASQLQAKCIELAQLKQPAHAIEAAERLFAGAEFESDLYCMVDVYRRNNRGEDDLVGRGLGLAEAYAKLTGGDHG